MVVVLQKLAVVIVRFVRLKTKKKHLKMERSRALFFKKKKIFEMQCCKRIWRGKTLFSTT